MSNESHIYVIGVAEDGVYTKNLLKPIAQI